VGIDDLPLPHFLGIYWLLLSPSGGPLRIAFQTFAKKTGNGLDANGNVKNE
jgi:hypothetical protein